MSLPSQRNVPDSDSTVTDPEMAAAMAEREEEEAIANAYEGEMGKSDGDEEEEDDSKPFGDPAPRSQAPLPSPLPPPHLPQPPQQQSKEVTFLLRHTYGYQLHPRTFIVGIRPNDTTNDTLRGVQNFFGSDVGITSYETEEGATFVPSFGNFGDGQTVYLRYSGKGQEDEDEDENWKAGVYRWMGEVEAGPIEREEEDWEAEARRKKEKARRRKINGGLTRQGRRRVWKASGGRERRRINGRFA